MRAAATVGDDLGGEARLVHALVAPGASVLDAGCGTGRVAGALAALGHPVVGVDADPVLLAAAAEDHPGRFVLGDLARLQLDEVFDAAVLAGNVLVYVTPGTERTVLASVAAHVRVGGVVVLGFATDRAYGVVDLDHDLPPGLVLESRFATWDLRPWHAGADWAVSVLRRT